MGEPSNDDPTPRVVIREQLEIKQIVISEEESGNLGHLFNQSAVTTVSPKTDATNEFDEMNAAIQRRKQQMQAVGKAAPTGTTRVIPSQIRSRPSSPDIPPLVPAKSPVPTTKKCPSCSAELPLIAKFCNKCGYKF